MGIGYKLQCRHCGLQFFYSSDGSYGVLPVCVGCGDQCVSEPRMIACPGCQTKILTATREFQDQVIEETIWE